ncbi:unnamed protein product, partial [Ectocarpus sp. 12 AP-2014]
AADKRTAGVETTYLILALVDVSAGRLHAEVGGCCNYNRRGCSLVGVCLQELGCSASLFLGTAGCCCCRFRFCACVLCLLSVRCRQRTRSVLPSRVSSSFVRRLGAPTRRTRFRWRIFSSAPPPRIVSVGKERVRG